MKPSEYLRSKSWIRGQSITTNSIGEITGCCMIGAICCSISAYEAKNKYLTTLYTILGQESVADWNDSAASTKKEVISKLEEVETILGL